MRLVAISDMHCGHELGLTHPDFDSKPNDVESPKFHLYQFRRKMWDFYAETLNALQPIDVLIDGGDNIDGRGEASGSTELLTTKQTEQCDMAVAAIQEVEAKKIFLVRGTPYHVGKQEDYEDIIAASVKADKIGDHDYLDVHGVVFDYAHEVGMSILPHTRFAPIARERFLNLLWAEHGEYPKADVILRGHAHYLAFCGEADWLAMTLPGLQLSSKYGRRKIRYTIHFGLVSFDIENKDDYSWRPYIKRLHKASQELIKI